MKHRFHLAILTLLQLIIIVWADSISAQSNNLWLNKGKFEFYFDSLGKLQYIFNRPNENAIGGDFAISDFNGSPLLSHYKDIYSNYSIFNINDKNEILNTKFNDSVFEGIGTSRVLLSIDTQNLCFLSLKHSLNTGKRVGNKVFTSILYRSNNTPGGFYVKNNSLFVENTLPDSILDVGYCRNKSSDIIIIFRTLRYFYSSILKNSGKIELMDSLYYPIDGQFPDSLDYLVNSKKNIRCFIAVSNLGRQVAFTTAYSRYGKSSLGVHNSLYCLNNDFFIMDFDKETGKFGYPKLIDNSRWHCLINPMDKITEHSAIRYSPNDSFLYIGERIWPIDFKSGRYEIKYDGSCRIRQIEIGTVVSKELFARTTDNSSIFSKNSPFFLIHNGEIAFAYRSASKNSTFLYGIKNINGQNPIVNNGSFIPDSLELYGLRYNDHLYSYLRSIVKISYDCSAHVRLINRSQYWAGFSDYKWIVQNQDGGEDYYIGKEPPELTYTKNGSYYFKLFGYSPKHNGYGEWYIDTIRIDIPPKPISSFFAMDTLVCRYSAARFINFSYSKDTISNSFTWHFGDGSTSNEKAPQHVYTKIGTYSVSLFYSNGYCDSTIVKNQYIRVIEAPKPGFQIESKQGCSPFLAHIKDTVKLNVKSKHYYFSDRDTWVNISNGQFDIYHQFNSKGKYRIVQKLIGFSGCIIQNDSVWVNVTKGLTSKDSLDVWNSTISNQMTPLIYWKPLKGALIYKVFRNSQIVGNTTDTFFYDKLNYEKESIYYVVGIDSCGTSSSFRLIGKPILLSGEILGNNEFSIINFTKYFDWGSCEPVYRIQKLDQGVWRNVSTQNDTTRFIDKEFLVNKEIQACYRIEAYEHCNNRISHSNEICVPYIPTIYIPTSFSPNGDGINDTFEPKVFGIKSYKITVFNQWGGLVEDLPLNMSWDGTNSQQGVYLVKIEYVLNTGIKQWQNVTVTLIK